jgi:hypothetical protein
VRLAFLALTAVLLVAAPSPARAQAPVPLAPPAPTKPAQASTMVGRSGPDGALPWAPPLEDRVHLRLDFAGAVGCSDAEVFDYTLSFLVRDWDAFAQVDPWPLKITIRRQGAGYTGSGELHDPAGALQWKATVSGPRRCVEIHQELVAGLVLSVFPPSGERPAPPPPETPAPTYPLAPEAAPVLLAPPLEIPKFIETPPEQARLAIRFGAAVWPEFIVENQGWFGVGVDAGVRYRAFSVGLEAHGDPPLGARPVPGIGSMSSARVIGTLVLCGHYPPFVSCIKGDAGAILFPDHAPSIPAAAPYGAIGGRVGVEYPVAPPSFLVRTTLDLSIPIVRTTVPNELGGAPAFTIASPNFGLGLGVVWDLGLR